MSENAAVKQLAEKVAALEAKVDPRNSKPAAPTEPSLAECNRRAREAMQEITDDKQDAATMAKKAIDEAFRGGPRARIQQKREQKNLSPMGAEMAHAAKAASDQKK